MVRKSFIDQAEPPAETDAMDIEEMKERYLNLEFDRKEFVIDPQRAAKIAQLSGETRPELADPDHPDFCVPPAYLASLASGRHLPIDFPRLGGLPIDGGKAVTCLHPVRPNQTLSGRTHLHDIFDKTGRSGRMIFLVSRMELLDADEQLLATSDSKMIIRERT